MLKIVGVKEPSLAMVEFGEYVPLNVEFDSERIPAAPFYWRTGDFLNSLVEIGINRRSGAIAKLGLIVFDGSEPLFNGEKYLEGSSIDGLPILNVDDWPVDRYRDELGYVAVMENDYCLCILFSPDDIVEFVYESGKVRFGVNSSCDLVWIAIRK
ncbi:hypothetical protein EGM97_14585 [Pseudomonas sp. AF32]|uniref:hypothetical protein n=1 Tax=Pseudomonas sp. AF32 TaxID=554390 RepID=UPI001EED5D7F|nr:hypothetical protein [Pseudomonas sp. AF32]MCG6575932.1 hypothetical protein [Pseudomonas sp. AF32]